LQKDFRNTLRQPSNAPRQTLQRRPGFAAFQADLDNFSALTTVLPKRPPSAWRLIGHDSIFAKLKRLIHYSRDVARYSQLVACCGSGRRLFRGFRPATSLRACFGGLRSGVFMKRAETKDSDSGVGLSGPRFTEPREFTASISRRLASPGSSNPYLAREAVAYFVRRQCKMSGASCAPAAEGCFESRPGGGRQKITLQAQLFAARKDF
jgi:hypothetical protein